MQKVGALSQENNHLLHMQTLNAQARLAFWHEPLLFRQIITCHLTKWNLKKLPQSWIAEGLDC